jgi:hypothetical protein
MIRRIASRSRTSPTTISALPPASCTAARVSCTALAVTLLDAASGPKVACLTGRDSSCAVWSVCCSDAW